MEKTILCSACQLSFEVVGSIETPKETPEQTIPVKCYECGSLNYIDWPIGCQCLVRRAD
jgi:hypothetical protein